MTKLFAALAAAFALAASPSVVFANAHKEAPTIAASGASAPMTGQQSKMVTCNKEATGKTGDDRKAFMKTCLSAAKPTQQSKMTTCNKDAGAMKGDERKAFMKTCLSA